MVILHIAHIEDNACNGVCIVVPQHVKVQQRYEIVGLMNISGYKFKNLQNQIDFIQPFSLSVLPEPFDRPDLVVFHELYRPEYLKIGKELRKRNVPYIILPHGGMTKTAQKKKWLKKKVANFLLFNRFIKHAKAIQCLSPTERDNIKFHKNKFIGTNGVIVPDIKKENFSKKGLKFIYIGRLEVIIKGLDLLIEAISRIADFMRQSNSKLFIYGPDYKGRYAQVQKLISKNEVADIVCLNTAIFGERKEEELLDSDIFIQTSRTEGAPTGIIEALSYGLPCIVTKGTTFADFVNNSEAGWGCNTDVDSIADAITNSIKEREMLPEKSINAINAIKENYTWDKVVIDALTAYKNIVGIKNDKSNQ